MFAISFSESYLRYLLSSPFLWISTAFTLWMLVDASRRDASTIGRHWGAVGRYLQHYDDSELRKLRGASINDYELETDLDVTDELAGRGELDFEEIYELAA